jgi:hypothetical protein
MTDVALPDPAFDLLRGVEKTSRFLNVPKRKAYYMCAKRLIPPFKEGGELSKTISAEHCRNLAVRDAKAVQR